LDNSVCGGTKYANTEAESGSNRAQYGVPGETGPSDRELGYASIEGSQGYGRESGYNNTSANLGVDSSKNSDGLMADAGGRWGQDNELRAGWDESGIRGEVNLREFWDDFNIAQCRAIDGSIQYRRIKPGVYPVADGIPNRVGRIRGYGNSIVPQLAAVFIRSFLEAVEA
jgi:DNA (cytosine-5)-methyltransferase 1